MNKERWGTIIVQFSDCNWKMPFGGMGTTQGKLKVGREAEALCLSFFFFFLTLDFFLANGQFRLWLGIMKGGVGMGERLTSWEEQGYNREEREQKCLLYWTKNILNDESCHILPILMKCRNTTFLSTIHIFLFAMAIVDEKAQTTYQLKHL